MIKKFLIPFIIFLVLVVAGYAIINVSNRKESKKIDRSSFYPKDTYYPEKISQEEYDSICNSIIRELEESFGVEGGFRVEKYERGTLKIGDVAAPQPYEKLQVYSKYLDSTFDGTPQGFLSSLLRENQRKLNEKLENISDKLYLSIDFLNTISQTKIGHIPTIDELPHECYSMRMSYSGTVLNYTTSDFDDIINNIKTDIKDAYLLVLDEIPSYKNETFEINYIIDNRSDSYKTLQIHINPNEKNITLESKFIELPIQELNWNDVF